MFRTVRIRETTGRLTTDASLTIDAAVPFTRGTIRHCPMLLPDSSYTQQEREQCRMLDVLNGEVRGPD